MTPELPRATHTETAPAAGQRPAGFGVSGGAALVLLALSLTGCFGPRNFENTNDQLRAENLQLGRQVEELRGQLQLRMGELEALRQQLEAEADTQPLQGAEPPVLAQLRIGDYSGAIDTDGDGGDDEIRIYLRPVDQRGRLLPVAGRAVVQAVAIPAEGEPTLVAERTYEPAEFDAAWRSGFTGDHYTLTLPLPDPLPSGLSEVTLKVTFTQARTGATLTAQQPVPIRHE